VPGILSSTCFKRVKENVGYYTLTYWLDDKLIYLTIVTPF